MIVPKEFLSKIRDFGLNSYESKLWTALLSRGISTAGELSDIANVPRSRSYDVLESLEKKGFIMTKIGKPIKYIAIPPNEAVDKVKKRIVSNTEKQINIIDSIREKEVFSELSTLYKQGIAFVQPTEFTGSIKDRDNIYNHLETMIKSATKSIFMVSTSSSLKNKINVLGGFLKKAKKRGVNIKIITDKKVLEDLSEIGEVRYTNKITGRFFCVDEQQVIFMLLHDADVHPAFDTGIWISSDFFAKALENTFGVLWDSIK